MASWNSINDILYLINKACLQGLPVVAENGIAELNREFDGTNVQFFLKRGRLAIHLPEGMGLMRIPYTATAAHMAYYVDQVDFAGNVVKVLKDRLS